MFPRSTTTRLAQLQPPDGARNCFPGFRKPRTVRSVVSSLDASDLSALAIVFLASEKACGINGIVMFVDGGTDALLNTEKVY